MVEGAEFIFWVHGNIWEKVSIGFLPSNFKQEYIQSVLAAPKLIEQTFISSSIILETTKEEGKMLQ